MKRVLILGATGSIGTTCLNAVRQSLIDIDIVGLVAHSNKDEAERLSKEFNCPYFINTDSKALEDFISSVNPDTTLNGIAGAAGLEASLIALNCGSDLALANKESVVMGGDFLKSTVKELGRRLVPVDSEHSAIYHLIQDHQDVESLVITASGGPFLGRKDLDSVTVEEAIKHPTWKMGKKISIDSSTLANKGLEVIEAGFLFDMPAEKIEVTIHRQSIIHSMIRLENGAVYAQLSPPDMTLPILSAIGDGEIALHSVVKPLSFKDLALTFTDWDRKEFPLLSLAYSALREKQAYPIAFNAADEVAVSAFIDHKIRYTDIARVVEETLQKNWSGTASSFDEIMDADRKAREVAGLCLSSF